MANKKDKDFALQNLYPLATLLTPNVYELNALSGLRNEDDSVKKLLDLGINKIYVTGQDVKKEIINNLNDSQYSKYVNYISGLNNRVQYDRASNEKNLTY